MENIRTVVKIQQKSISLSDSSVPRSSKTDIPINFRIGKTINHCISVLDSKNLQVLPANQCSCEFCISKIKDKCESPQPKSPSVHHKIYQFDNVLSSNTSLQELYDCVSDNVKSLFSGVSSTVLTLGPVGSGKSYIMRGEGKEKQMGIVPRALHDIFQYIEKAQLSDPHRQFCVELNYIELANNSFRNLLPSHITENMDDSTSLNKNRPASPQRLKPCATKSPSKSLNSKDPVDDRLELHRDANGSDYFTCSKGSPTVVNLEVETEKEALEAIAAADKLMLKSNNGQKTER